MKTVTIDVSEHGACAIGAVSDGMSPGLAHAILEDYRDSINPGIPACGVLPRGHDENSAPYWVYSWEELVDLALERAEAASAPEIRRGARDDLDIEEGAFGRYVLAEMGAGWVAQHPYGSLRSMAVGLEAGAADLLAGARALRTLAATHKVWMQAEKEAES